MPNLSQLENVGVSSPQPDDGKYRLGNVLDTLYNIKHRKPIFAFDYLSDDCNDYSLINSKALSLKDYKKFFAGIKRISNETYESLSVNQQFHFHSVDWSDTTLRRSEFEKHIKQGKNNDQDIIAYQVKLFEEARIFGFLYLGVFYIVLFDRNHNIYKRK